RPIRPQASQANPQNVVCQRRADDQKPQGRKTASARVRRAGKLALGAGQPCSSLTFRTGAKLERPATRRFLLQFAPPYRGATGVERSTRMLQLAQSKLERKWSTAIVSRFVRWSRSTRTGFSSL